MKSDETPKFLGSFMGEDAFGNEACDKWIRFLTENYRSQCDKNAKLEMENFRLSIKNKFTPMNIAICFIFLAFLLQILKN